MLFVIPVSLSDIKLLDAQIDAMEYFGGLRNHQVLFVPTPSVYREVSDKAARLRSVCPSVSVEQLPREPQGGWPVACNMQFRDTVELLAQRNNALPWFWMEVDVTPIRGGWADQLETEYNRNGARFMGVIRDVKEVLFKNDVPVDDGRYMVGVGVYPWNFKEFSMLYQKVGVPDSKTNPPIPFDVRIRWEINPLHNPAHHTNLIAHHRQTGNYRREDGVIKCDDLQERPAGRVNYGGAIPYGAALVHGCRDGSLARLILGEVSGQVSEAKSPQNAPESQETAPEPPKTAVCKQTSPKEMFQTLCDALEIPQELRDSKWQVLTTHSATDLTKDKLEREQKEIEDELDEDLTSPDAPKLTMASLQAYMEKAEGPVELGTIAADFGAKKGIVSMLVNNPASGLKRNGELVECATVPA